MAKGLTHKLDQRDKRDMADVTVTSKKIIANIEKVVIGKRQRSSWHWRPIFREGHILLEDVPGVAKTMLARALASSVGASFKRVQCTPDLLPTDITGRSIFNQKRPVRVPTGAGLFADSPGRRDQPGDPRTQAALLEAMGERKVSVDGTTFDLKPPFLVIATQNPVDHEGTFPLPEAQLDRFWFGSIWDIRAPTKRRRCSPGNSSSTRSMTSRPSSAPTRLSAASKPCGRSASTTSWPGISSI